MISRTSLRKHVENGRLLLGGLVLMEVSSSERQQATAPETLPAHYTSDEPHVLDVCSHVEKLRGMPPVRPVLTPAGETAWLISGYAENSELSRDSRLGRPHLRNPADLLMYVESPTQQLVLGGEHASETDRDQFRALLRPPFAAKHMEALRPRLEAIADDLLEAIIAQSPPVDLHADLSVPFVTEAFWELFGVPSGDRPLWTEATADADEMARTIPAFLYGLLRRKRESPGDDMISHMCEMGAADEWIIGMASASISAGFGTTIRQVDYGIAMLLQDHDQREALLKDPALLPKAVEEVLRISGTLNLPRFARQDIEIAGVTIRENDLVLLDLTWANFDDAVFDRPACMDTTRMPNRHMSFAQGPWACPGAPFARLVMQTAFGRLFALLPDLVAAEPADRLRRNRHHTLGLAELLVTWERGSATTGQRPTEVSRQEQA